MNDYQTKLTSSKLMGDAALWSEKIATHWYQILILIYIVITIYLYVGHFLIILQNLSVYLSSSWDSEMQYIKSNS